MKNIKKFIKTYIKGLLLCLLTVVIAYVTTTYLNNTTISNDIMYAAIVLILLLFTEVGIGHTLEFLIGSEQNDKLQKIKDRNSK